MRRSILLLSVFLVILALIAGFVIIAGVYLDHDEAQREFVAERK